MHLSCSNLYIHQKKAIRLLYRGKNVFNVTPTNSGKSITGFCLIWLALARGKVAAYIVPTNLNSNIFANYHVNFFN